MDVKQALKDAYIFVAEVARSGTKDPEAWRGDYLTVSLLIDTIGLRVTLPGRYGPWFALGLHPDVPFKTYAASVALPGGASGKEVELFNLQVGSILNVGICEKLSGEKEEKFGGFKTTGGGLQAEFRSGPFPEPAFTSAKTALPNYADRSLPYPAMPDWFFTT